MSDIKSTTRGNGLKIHITKNWVYRKMKLKMKIKWRWVQHRNFVPFDTLHALHACVPSGIRAVTGTHTAPLSAMARCSRSIAHCPLSAIQTHRYRESTEQSAPKPHETREGDAWQRYRVRAISPHRAPEARRASASRDCAKWVQKHMQTTK